MGLGPFPKSCRSNDHSRTTEHTVNYVFVIFPETEIRFVSTEMLQSFQENCLNPFRVGNFAVLTIFMTSHLVVLGGNQNDLVAVVREENTYIRAEIAELKALIKQAGETDE